MDTSDQADVKQQNIDTDVEETTPEPKETPKPQKQEETTEARIARLERQLKRARRDAGVEDEPDAEPVKQTRSSDLDYGQKAYLASYGIKGSDELALVKQWMSRTGDTLDNLVEDEIFTAKLSGLRKAREVIDATPSNSKRTATPARDKVEYWLAKGEMPPADQVQLRREYVNAKYKKASEGDKFTSNPVAGR